MKRKLIAFVLVIALLVGLVPGAIGPVAQAADGSTNEYTELSLKDFGITTSKEVTQDGKAFTTPRASSLDNTAVTGLYNMQDGAQFFIGENWYGIHVSVYEQTTLCFAPYGNLLGHTGIKGENNTDIAGLYFYASNYDYDSWEGRDIKIRAAFKFTNVSGDKADVTVTITVDDTATQTMTVLGADKARLYQSIGVYLPEGSKITMTEPNPDEYQELSLKDFNISTSEEVTTDGKAFTTPRASSLDKTAVTGLYNMEDGAQFFIGENWYGIHVSVIDQTTLCFVPYVLLGHTGIKGENNTDIPGLYFYASNYDYDSWEGRDIKIRAAFRFTNVSEDKADVTVTITVDDEVTQTMTALGADKAHLYQSIGVYLPEGSKITMTEPNPDEYEELSLKDFGINYVKNIYVDGTIVQTQSAGTLDRKAVTGLYNLQGGGQFFIGENWYGIHVSVVDKTTLCFVPYVLLGHTGIKGENNADIPGLYFYASNYDYDSWEERDIKIRAAFRFTNVSEDKADVTVTITVDDEVTQTMTVLGADKVHLYQSIGVYLPEGSKITMTEPNPDPEPNYEPFTPENYGFKGYTLVSDETVLKELSSEKTLDGTCITGDYKFSPNGGIVCFGGYWTGVRIQSLDNGKFEVRFQLEGTEQYVDDAFNNIILTPEDAGMTLTDRVINLKMGFEVTEQEGTMGTLVVRMTIDNSFTQLYTFKNVPLAYTKQIMMAWSSTNGTVVLNASDEVPAAPTVNPAFKQLTFDSYLVYSGVYGYNGSNDLLAGGNCGLDSLDKVVFTDTINITDKPGANLYIGGKTNGWEGLILGSAENGNLVLVYNGQSILFTSAKAGVQLTDNDVKITFSFEYVDADEDGATDDVKLGVWFNGVAYNNKWIYLNDYADKLGGFIGVYSAVEGAALTVKTYNAPIDFAEWGFTKDWAKTLGLV